MTYSDFDETAIMQDEDGNEVSKAPEQQKVKRKGRFVNIRKMATHTKIVP